MCSLAMSLWWNLTDSRNEGFFNKGYLMMWLSIIRLVAVPGDVREQGPAFHFLVPLLDDHLPPGGLDVCDRVVQAQTTPGFFKRVLE